MEANLTLYYSQVFNGTFSRINAPESGERNKEYPYAPMRSLGTDDKHYPLKIPKPGKYHP